MMVMDWVFFGDLDSWIRDLHSVSVNEIFSLLLGWWVSGICGLQLK